MSAKKTVQRQGFKTNENIVYPSHGVGKIIDIEEQEVAGMKMELFVIHFEKGDTQYKGIYQAINQMFLANSAGRFSLVNREQDLGDPGLRKAKLSYHPIELLQKYRVVIKGNIRK